MFTWNVYYEEYERRQNLLEEARQFRLINILLNIKENRSKKTFRIQPKSNLNNKVLVFGNK